MDRELISIIIPVYNVEKYIVETIETVRSQSYRDWELLLIEDQSTDQTLSVIRTYVDQVKDNRIRVIALNKNQGAAKARNAGVSMAQGRYIAYLDADDLWCPNKLERELAYLKQMDAAFVFTGYEFVDEQAMGSGKVVKVPKTLNYKEALKNTTIFTSTVMFDTKKIQKELLQMPEIKSEDTALWWKILRKGFIAHGLNENLVKYRRTGNSLSSNKLEAIRRIWNLYRQAEGLGVVQSAWNFCFWAVRAVLRRV